MKKLAVVVSGWHFPLHFYKKISEQQVPQGWEIHKFVVAHREPVHAERDVKEALADIPKRGLRNRIDHALYKEVATEQKLKDLGWTVVYEPNTIGDWGNTNQWLEKNDYKQYDLFLFSHDDNYIIGDELFVRVVGDKSYDEWLILTNSINVAPDMRAAVPKTSVRGSFEFFKKEMLDKLGGKFDLSRVSLSMVGKVDTKDDLEALYDWNSTTVPLGEYIDQNNLRGRVYKLSPFYRVSPFCIEGERGFVSKTHGINTDIENRGIDELVRQKILNTRKL
jgi:hypothetical protein